MSLKTRVGPDVLISLIGHELQHAAEVAAASEVVDDATLTALYRRIGDPSSHGWDTIAARAMGSVVADELAGSANAVVTEAGLRYQ